MKPMKEGSERFDKENDLKRSLLSELQKGEYGAVYDTEDKKEKLADLILDSGVRISTPIEPVYLMSRYISKPSFSSPAKSVKPGNIRLNIRDFFLALGTGVGAIPGMLAFPYLAFIPFLVLWNQISKAVTVDLGDAEGKTIWAMCALSEKEGKKELTFDEISTHLNQELQERDLPPMKSGEITDALQNLEKIKSVQNLGNQKWRVIEWIKRKY